MRNNKKVIIVYILIYCVLIALSILFITRENILQSIGASIIAAVITSLLFDFRSWYVERRRNIESFNYVTRECRFTCIKFYDFILEKYMCRSEQYKELNIKDWEKEVLFSQSNEERHFFISMLGGIDYINNIKKIHNKLRSNNGYNDIRLQRIN